MARNTTKFTKMDDDLVALGLPKTLVLLYGKLRFRAGNNGECWPSHATLAREIGLKTRQQVGNLLDRLRLLRLVTWTRGRYSNSYVVLDPDDKWILRQMQNGFVISDDKWILHKKKNLEKKKEKTSVVSEVSIKLRDAADAGVKASPPRMRLTLQESSSSNKAFKLAYELSENHPRIGSVQKAATAIEWLGYSDELSERLRRMHPLYIEHYAKYKPDFVPNLARWIGDGDWRHPPEIPKKVMSKEDDIAAIDAGIQAALRRKATSNGR